MRRGNTRQVNGQPHRQLESRSGLIIVEAYIIGRDYRSLVIDGKIAAIAERVPAHVIAGGRTPSKLVAKTSADLRRGDENLLTRIKIDGAAIDPVAAQGFSMENCHPNGTVIKLTLTGSMFTGGISIRRRRLA